MLGAVRHSWFLSGDIFFDRKMIVTNGMAPIRPKLGRISSLISKKHHSRGNQSEGENGTSRGVTLTNKSTFFLFKHQNFIFSHTKIKEKCKREYLPPFYALLFLQRAKKSSNMKVIQDQRKVKLHWKLINRPCLREIKEKKCFCLGIIQTKKVSTTPLFIFYLKVNFEKDEVRTRFIRQN